MTTIPISWPEAQRICDIPEVREALDKFAVDACEDHMLAMVSAVLTTAMLPQPRFFPNDGSQPEDDAHLHCPACNGSGHVADITAAARDVLAERRRQQEVEGWTTDHDDEHVSGEISALAAFYAMPPAARDWDASSTGYGEKLGEAMIPPCWYAKPGDRREELKKAGALILAEIERLDRAALAAKDKP